MTTPHRIQRVCHRIRCVATDTAESGFTLVEILVSFVIFAVVVVGAATSTVNAVQASHLSQQRADAANVAQAAVAQVIADASKNKTVPESGKSFVSNVGDGSTVSREKFSITRWITFDTGNACHPGSVFTVNIEVRQSDTGHFLARSDSRVACPPA
jgi:prepilin-type N-terminal cleavage/methylation domain-containing protein